MTTMFKSRHSTNQYVSTRRIHFDKRVLENSPVLLFLLLSGCGGGGGSTDPESNTDDVTAPILPEDPSVAKNGKVVDGYVAGSKVFYDLNKNYVQDLDEVYSVTNKTGDYLLPVTLGNDRLLASHNNYKAIDTAHGMSFSITLSAPVVTV